MSAAPDQALDLERNILRQAQQLAEEHLAHGRAVHDRILGESAERLRRREQEAILAARAGGEQLYRRQVQAAELRLHAETDRLRWTLANAVMDQLRGPLEDVARSAAYANILLTLLREGARAIGATSLRARINSRDRARFAGSWQALVEPVLPGIAVALDDETLDASGGVMVMSEDGRIRVDNSFEGRLERMRDDLYRAIMQRLFANTAHVPMA